MAVWRGVKNNARVFYIGTDALIKNMDHDINMTEFVYDTISWFGMQSNLLRAVEFEAINLDLNKASTCRKALSLAEFTPGIVREGSLVLLKLTAE